MIPVKGHKTTFFRIVTIFVILIVPLILMAIFMYDQALTSIKQNAMDSVKSRGFDYIFNFEQNVERIKMLQMDMLRDEDIWELCLHTQGLTEYNNLLALRRIQLRLRSAMLGSSYIEDFRAHIFPLNKTISAHSGFEKLSVLFDEKIIVPSGVYGAQLVQTGERYSFTTRRENQTQLLFDIEVVLDKEKIHQSLVPLVMDNQTTVILFFGDQLSVVSYVGDEEIAQKINSYGVEDRKNLVSNEMLRIEGEKYLVSKNYSKYLDMLLLQIVPYKTLLAHLNYFYTLLWIYVFCVIVVLWVFVVYATRFFRKPLDQMVEAFHRAEKGDLNVTVEISGDTEFNYLGKQFNSMVGSIRTLINRSIEQELLVRNAELKQLQAQINPHFLYNSFYILARLIKLEDLDKAKILATDLGKYFRYITHNAMDEVPLVDEWEHASVYAEIMKIRFSQSIQIEICDLPEEAHNVKVPRLILQPLIENTFKHGIRNVENNAQVSMKAEFANGDILINIFDNGVGINQEEVNRIIKNNTSGKHDQVTGVANINKRLKLKFGEAYGLYFRNVEGQGTLVEVRIPGIHHNGNS